MTEEDTKKELSWMEKNEIEKIIKSVEDPKYQKIEMLQKLQGKYKWLQDKHMKYLAETTGVSYTDLYGIATFYTQFKLHPPGRHKISVCMGTGCHVKGGKKILEKLKDLLEIDVNETTEDRRFSLDQVRCLGCCGLAPVINIDGETFGRVSTKELEGILEEFK